MDRISSLPDGIISHILSFRPIKMAAQTSVLSKRWRNLFAFSPNLDLIEDSSRESFIDFVDRMLFVSGNSPIKKFSLWCGNGFDQGFLNLWICDVLNRGVLDLNLIISRKSGCSLHSEVFNCKTIVKLTLSGYCIDVFHVNAFLPALKTLSLNSVWVDVCVFEELISACPVLEELNINDLNWGSRICSRTVSSPTLQRLDFSRTDYHECAFGSFIFDTPNLTYLRYSDSIPNSCPVFNLDSLVEANFGLGVTFDDTVDSSPAGEKDHITSNRINLIKGLRNVKIMGLSSVESLEMFYLFREAIPVFENLFCLSITTISECCWRGLPFLLNKSPNLETLIIVGPLHFLSESSVCECLLGYSFLLSCPVKVLEITDYSGTTGEVEQVKHLLGKLSCLELLKVCIWGTEKDKLQISEDLLMFPRASSKCKIEVKNNSCIV